jgi:serine phosphatase RsbU (regulator of sigma subunit)
MALISDTPHAERERVLAQVNASGDRLVKYALNPLLLNEDERRRAGELGVASARQALQVSMRLDIDLNEVAALSADIDQLTDDIEQRLLRENDPIETGPEAAAGYWQERAEQAENVLAEIDKRVNVHYSLTEATMDEVRALLIAFYDAKSRD